MKTARQKKKADLLKRVNKAKEFLIYHNPTNAKADFCDTVYGAMYKKEAARIDNLWSGKTTDEEFTIKLEEFAKNPKRKLKGQMEFTRFQAFVKWYMALGGAPLTPEDIERAYPKFKIN